MLGRSATENKHTRRRIMIVINAVQDHDFLPND